MKFLSSNNITEIHTCIYNTYILCISFLWQAHTHAYRYRYMLKWSFFLLFSNFIRVLSFGISFSLHNHSSPQFSYQSWASLRLYLKWQEMSVKRERKQEWKGIGMTKLHDIYSINGSLAKIQNNLMSGHMCKKGKDKH